MNVERDLIAPERVARTRAQREAQLQDHLSFALETVWRRRDGTRLPLRISGSLVELAGRPVVQVILVDITERVERERLSREFSRHTVQRQEQERRRVARELHDSVNQTLSAAASRLHLALDESLPIPSRTHLEKAHQYLGEAIVEIRRICRDLRPTVLDDLGLLPALRSLARAFEERTGIQVQVEGGTGSGLGRDAESSLYRIVQEALTNVERHAAARRVQLAVDDVGQALRLSLRDDGRGFDPQAPGQGMGLRNMRERADLLGAAFEVASSPGGGTCIRVDLPLAEARVVAAGRAPAAP